MDLFGYIDKENNLREGIIPQSVTFIPTPEIKTGKFLRKLLKRWRKR